MGQALAKLVGAGLCVSIKPDGNTLIVVPATKITPDIRQYIISHKAELLAELNAANDDYQRVVLAFHLKNGKGGVLIDPDGVASAVSDLLGRYGERLDVLALVVTLQGMGESAKTEAARLIERLSCR
ncbi:hypothetical protein ABHF33_03915 [Chitinibacter sp. FCG-7]|uniref:TubC N-terminal docking domain-containing protein n=1 Tax=Chitinibacter mangrovi TaxID=3153927 RepID=A0AAU7FCD7_9NEIS